MSNLPLPSAVLHNDDNDDQTHPTNPKLSSINSRITSRSILKRQQYIETRIANNQACDEIHDLQPKHSGIKKTNSKPNYPLSSHELMQGNYYDRTRFNLSLSNHQSEPGQIDISVEDYKDCKKKYTPVSTSENSSYKDRSNSPPFGDTSESIQHNIAQRAGRLLESNKNHLNSMNNNKSHEQAAINYFPNDNDNQPRSSSPSSSDFSTDDSSTSNKCVDDNEKSNIPYEKLLNDEDEDEEIIEQPTKLVTESSTLLNKNLSQTYGTQSTLNERSKCITNNGYNSHGSSITTKSSSDNSGSIRTNSGSDNDEESDEEHYNNSTASNNPSIYSQIHDSSMKSVNNKKCDDTRYLYRNEGNRQSNPTRLEQTDEQHLQIIPRIKQIPTDDSNGNNNQLNSIPDHNEFPSISKRSSQQSSTTNQTNNTSSSSQQNRNHLEQQNSRQNPSRKAKKRKQSQQQDIIRTELIPGHRGDRDVDELVMFIDGNSIPLSPTDTNKPRIASKMNSLNDSNSNKTLTRKKSRKSIKSNSSVNDNENQDDQTNPSLSEQPSLSIESHSNTVDIPLAKTTNGETSLSNWFEQTQDKEPLSPSIINPLTNEIVSEPFVTVTHRRRLVKERRQDNPPVSRSPRFPPPPPQTSSSLSNTNDKRRVPSTSQNGVVRPTIPNKSDSSPIIKEENHQNNHNPIPLESMPPSSSSSSSIVNPVTEQSLEKQQSSPRLSSHSSSSSLSSLLKRQNKPPVVFLNKSIDIELNDVSFGFDLDSNTLDQTSADINDKPSTIELVTENPTNPFIEHTQSNEMSTQKSHRKYPQRNNRGPQFYSGSDIRPQHHRTYPTQPIPQSPYIDPLLLLQYNQQRLANYSQQMAYMNLLRAPYISPQSQYIYLPPTYPTATTTNEAEPDEEPNDQVQVVYATPTGQIYFQLSNTKKPYPDSEQIVAPIPTVYPTQYYYPSQVQHVIPSHSAYFQPIPSTSLVIETKSEQNDIDDIDLEDDYENSTKSYHQKHQPSSSDIMSNALQLVYSQQRRNAQTDRFNLDDLTSYLAMKWTDAVDHYIQGDSRILLVDDQ
jgi:hypothetical protein